MPLTFLSTHKVIKVFKDNYIFGGAREGDRKFVSDLIKKATGMNDHIVFCINRKSSQPESREDSLF